MIVNVVYGFLGAGKTTFIKYVMENPPAGEKVAIIVNEFGEVGVDGLIFASDTGVTTNVIELPSGCICCTMAADFRRQFLDLHEQYRPDRVIVEPTGVAMITQINQILEAEDIQRLYTYRSLIHIVDSTEFLDFVKRQRHFMINQLRASRVVLLNKTDRVKTHMLKLLVESVKEINPDADVYATSFGRLDQAVVKEVLGGPSISPLPEEHRERAQDEHEHEHEHEGEHEHEDEDSFARQFETFSKKYDKIFDPQRLEIFFERLRDQDYGDVVRAKGIFRTPLKWIKLELASREVRIDPVPATDVSVVSIIGRAINTKEIESDLIGCQR